MRGKGMGGPSAKWFELTLGRGVDNLHTFAIEKKAQPLQQMLLRKVVLCLQKTETRSMFITL
jgi:hypothetical protein